MPIERTHESLRSRLAVLLAPLAQPASLPAGWRLDEWDCEQGITLTFRGRGAVLDVELEGPDPKRLAFARTARFNVYYSSLERDGRPLSDDERRILDTVAQVLRSGEAALPPMPPAPAPGPKIRVREVVVDRALVHEEVPTATRGAYYLNPYVGCMLACPFCYAMHRADFSRSLEGEPAGAWGRWVDVKLNAPEVLQAEVKALPPGYVRMSPIITDPYQPLERKYRITRRVLEVLGPAGFSPVVLTRASLVLEDVERLQACAGACVGMSVPTDDDAVRAEFEPGTEPIEARLETLAALARAGLRTFGIIQPMLPGDPERLVSLLAPHVQAVRIGPLFEKPRALPMFERLGRRDATEEKWELATFARLKAGFEDRGIPVNPVGPEWSFLR
jgi:DNA repair photolyase